MEGRRRNDSVVLWVVFALSVAATLLTLVGAWLAAPPPPPPDAGPSYPRVPMVPQSPAELLRLMRIGSLTWYVSLLSAPLFVVLGRHFPFERGRWPISLAGFTVVIVALAAGTAFAQHRLTYAGAPLVPPLGGYLLAAGLTSLLPFVAMAAVAQALEARTRARDRELESALVKAELVEARLAALTARLQPHFLFNTLQGISTLIPHDPTAADRMLTQLSDLLREVLRHGERRYVTLEEELAVLRPYLDISKARFGPRLQLHVEIEEGARSALVPFFLLQPLVENALEHGAGDRSGPATVRIAATRYGDRLRMSVTDDGPGLDPHGLQPGLGLSNTRARLAQLYGDAGVVELHGPDGGGLEVRIEIPWVEAPPETA
jgi:two-component system, LytTR family, sensor kinase